MVVYVIKYSNVYFDQSYDRVYAMRTESFVPSMTVTNILYEWLRSCVTLQAVAWVVWSWPGSGVGSSRRIDIWGWGYRFICCTIRQVLHWQSWRWMIGNFCNSFRSEVSPRSVCEIQVGPISSKLDKTWFPYRVKSIKETSVNKHFGSKLLFDW